MSSKKLTEKVGPLEDFKTTNAFFVRDTFIRKTRLRFNSKLKQSQVSKDTKRK